MTIRETVLERFSQHYGYSPMFIVRAPGRANLIGEHTDYSEGFVLPLAVNRAVWMSVAPRQDNQIRVFTLDFGDESITFSTEHLKDDSLPHWTTYIRGAWWLMQQQGYSPSGADIVIGSDIPIGGGMSSSAAIGVAAIEAVLALLNIDSYTQSEKALLAVQIEHQFTGVPVGVMDQMASAAPTAAHAILLDCRSLEMTPVPIPSQAKIVVINSMKERTLVGSAYAERRQQCEAAAAMLGASVLRDVAIEQVEANAVQLGDVLYRRARHVVNENARTAAMVDTMHAGDLLKAGELINTSHYSLRDDFEVSVMELDVLTEIARNYDACYGARIMGGGFGGCAVSLVRHDGLGTFIEVVQRDYFAHTGLSPEFYVCEPTPGSSVEYLA